MTADLRYGVGFVVHDRPQDFVSGVFERSIDLGFEPEDNPSDDPPAGVIQSDIDDIRSNRFGTVCLSYGCLVDFIFDLEADKQEFWGKSALSVDADMEAFGRELSESFTKNGRTFVEAVLELVRQITTFAEPEYVYSNCPTDNDAMAVVPEEPPVHENISKIPWVAVFSPPTVDALGGRDHVLETPAYLVEELDTGHVLLVRRSHPVGPADEPDDSAEDHLL
jgi:hypothetical protein